MRVVRDALLIVLLTAATFLAVTTSIAHTADSAQPGDTGESQKSRPPLELLLQADQSGSEGRPELDAERAPERAQMVATQIESRGVDDSEVLEAMRKVPRHELVPPERRDRAYADSPLPIGHGQTISQPFIVAFMTEQLNVEAGDRVLEIGTGSGYQAAVLGQMGVNVVSIEIVPELARQAAQRLNQRGFDNITVFHGDGYYGYEPEAPYDAIVVTAAAEHVPPPLIAQLKTGGRMLIPVGRAGWTQNLLLVEKREDATVQTRNLMSVAFVPLTGER